MNPPRVAFFTDSFHESNGVALTSREFAKHARSHFYPFFSVHAGPKTSHWTRGSFQTFELANSSMLLQLEHDLAFDLRFARHRPDLRRAVAAFAPDLVHITGPSHIGMLGALIAYDLGVPLVASWHTNIHEFAAQRLRKLLVYLPDSWTNHAAGLAERKSLDFTLRFYQLARMLFAPNPELIDLLTQRTSRPAHLMERGIDTELFSPAHRRRESSEFLLGYVGRLSAEKNVRMLRELDRRLKSAGLKDHRFLILGEGSERAWLRENLENAELPGVLRGQALSDAYAAMDVFVFPSETDTFGNVILEAAASGVPSVVSHRGGPKFLVKPGVTGFIAEDSDVFCRAILELRARPELLQRMRQAAREAAMRRSWSAVCDGIYNRYRQAMQEGLLLRRQPRVNRAAIAYPQRFVDKTFPT